MLQGKARQPKKKEKRSGKKSQSQPNHWELSHMHRL